MLLHFLWHFLAFIIALGMLVTVHECGHFLTARFCKVKIERFSIGFGPALWKWRDSNNTEYVISIILIGGYVKLFNTQVQDTNLCNINNSFNCKNIWQKTVIILSGSIFNFIFSILLYTLVYMIGVPIDKPIIHTIIPNSIIAQSGISSGVEIASINNVQTRDWEEVRFQCLNSIGKEKIIISTKSTNDMYCNTYTVHLPKDWFNTNFNIIDPIIGLGILPCNARMVPIISSIEPDSVAGRNELKIGDKILAIDNQLIYDWNSFITNIKNHPEKIFKISIERQHKILYFYIKPDKKYLINSTLIEGSIGIFPKIIFDPIEYHKFYQYNLHDAMFRACNQTWELIHLVINTLKKLITGNINIINVGGPISIAKGAGNAAQHGLIYYLMFLAIVSINLGIVNLLPFPALDGGRLFFLILEKIYGKPISQTIQDFGYIIGFILLILVMCFTCFNDISRL